MSSYAIYHWLSSYSGHKHVNKHAYKYTDEQVNKHGTYKHGTHKHAYIHAYLSAYKHAYLLVSWL